MKFVKLTEDVGVRRAGEILELDSGSAASLVEVKKVGEYVDSKDGAEADRSAPARGTMSATQIVDADEPSPVSTLDPGPDSVDGEAELTEGEQIVRAEVVDGDGVTHTGELPAGDPSMDETKDNLVARATAAGIDEAEARALTKAQIVDRLTSDG